MASADLENRAIRVLGDIARVQAGACPNRAALVFEDRVLSFAALEEDSERIACALRASGLAHGARVALLDKNSDTFLVLLLAVAKAGLVAAPINFRLTAQEVGYILADSEAQLCFAGADLAHLARAAQALAPGLKSVITIDAPYADQDSLPSWLERHQHTAVDLQPVQPHDCAIQLYTSGTTGHPKGVELSHRAMVLAAVEGLGVWPALFREGAAVLAAMPLFHIAGCNLALAGLYAGARVEIVRGGSPSEIIRMIAERSITVAPLPAATIHDIISLPETAELDLRCLDTLLIAGSGIAVGLLREAQRVLKCGFALSYGMTECCGGLTYLGPQDCVHDAGDRLRSAGKPLGGSQIRIVDAAGADVAPRCVGEILCRSARVMNGYWKRPDATAQVLRDGWYHSGDAGYLDEDGYLYVVDRIKDMVVSGGENIYPAEIEAVLVQHPDVDQAAVIGTPHAKWGEALLACVVIKPGARFEPSSYEAFLRPVLAGYKIPRRYAALDALPRNASGKVLKRELRDRFAATTTG
jgi:acyl-CoA synthetase (AMP-forming)/AMP-acid ligase II